MTEEIPGGPENAFAKEKKRLNRLAEELRAKDFYSRLEIDSQASEKEIKKALRKFTEFHPDSKPPELQEEYTRVFQLYMEAVNTLRNPDERRKYDAQLGSYGASSWEPPREERRNPFRGEGTWYPKANPKQSAFESILGGLDALGMGDFIYRRDEWVRRGVVTKDEVHRDQRVRDFALKAILVGVYFGPTRFARRKNDWISEGILTEEEVNKNPQVKELVVENILNGLRLGVAEFVSRRDGWVREKIVSEKEINVHPAVREYALDSLRESSSEEAAGERLNEWKQAGVLTDADATRFRS